MMEIWVVVAVVLAILFLKGFDRIAGRAPKTDKPSGPTRACPFCAEDVKAAAVVCKHCGKDLTPTL